MPMDFYFFVGYNSSAQNNTDTYGKAYCSQNQTFLVGLYMIWHQKYNSPFYFALEHCGVPVLENATVEMTGTLFKLNDKLEYKCLDGFENRDGNTTGYMVCGEDGWSHVPTCYSTYFLL